MQILGTHPRPAKSETLDVVQPFVSVQAHQVILKLCQVQDSLVQGKEHRWFPYRIPSPHPDADMVAQCSEVVILPSSANMFDHATSISPYKVGLSL